MNHKPNITNVVFSILIGVTLILSAINPTSVHASALAINVTPPTKPPTPTATPEVTPSPTPVVTQAPISYEPALSLQSDPTYITSGGQVTFLYQIANLEIFSETTLLRFHVPLGFAPIDPEAGKYDQEAGIFDLPVTESEGKIEWQADDTIVPPVGIYAELIQGETTIAEAIIELAAPDEYTVEATGGTAEGMGGEVQVNFPAGAVSETVKVKVTKPSFESLPVRSLSGSPFEITAISENSREEVSQFSQPVEIIVNYDERSLDGSEDDLLLFWFDPADGEWKMPLSQRVDKENNRIIATTDHFTVFDTYNSNWQTSEVPTLSGFQTSNFTGASSFTLPIKVPAGPGGFQPSLTLGYNSMVVDGASSETQASWVGMGWSLTTSAIERNGHGTNGVQDDSYQLTLNGISTELLPDASGKYHATNENFYRMELSDPANDSISKWTIWDKSGYKYIFDHRTYTTRYSACDTGAEIHHDVWRWSLAQVVNPFGQTMEYSYDKETSDHYYLDCGAHQANATMENWVYPSAITYANNKYKIVFDRVQDRTDYKSIWNSLYSSAFNVFQRSRLSGIRVLESHNGVFDTVVREYRFTYVGAQDAHIFPNLTWDAGGKTLTLLSVQEYGLGGYNNGQGPSLPPYEFEYDDGMHLTNAENGYGGEIEFDYDDWNAVIPYEDWDVTATGFAPPAWGNPKAYHFTALEGWERESLLTGYITANNGSATTWGQVLNPNDSLMASKAFQPGRWYLALARVKAANTGGTHNIKIGFGHQLPGGVTDQYGSVTTLNSQFTLVVGGPFFVPAEATALIPKMYSTGSSVVDWYYLYPLTTAYRVSSQTISANGDSLQYTYAYDGAAVNTSANSEAAAGSHPYLRPYTEFRGHETVTVTDPFGGQTVTQFDQSDCHAGSPTEIEVKDSGNVTAQSVVYEYDECTEGTSSLQLYDQDTRDPNLYGTQFDPLKYYWGTTHSETKTVYGTVSGSLATVYSYDSTYGNLLSQEMSGTNLSTLTTYYEYFTNPGGDYHLVSLPSHVWTENAGGTIAESINVYGSVNGHNGILLKTRALMRGSDYAQVSYGYDTWGNVTSATTWSGYGSASSDPTTGAQTATTTYDSDYHTYPLTITNALTQTTTLTYDYTLGVPLSVYGPNGTNTAVSAEYDLFGRLVKLIRPGDDSASPTLQIAYTGTNPFTVTLTQKIQSGQFYTVTRQYDGLGRPTSVSAGGTSTLYQYGYDSGVRADYVSTPYASGETYYWAETKYDSLGRAWKSIAPNGTQTTYAYNGLETKVTDANGVETITTTDILGRTKFVDAPIGPDIIFDYDDLGNLITASRGGATTTMQYDLGGRKTSMSDPDMGAWTYGYDALGNLLTQVDARSCTLTMTYDALNRLDTKISSGAYCGQQINVDYGYDSGTYGIGFRTSMSDGTSTLPSSWEYDARGRLVKEIKRIDSQSFTTEWTYNSADMPVSMTYPDGEVVTNTYSSQMLLTSVAGSETYASAFTYDSANRLKALNLGSTLGQRYYYKEWNMQGGGRLDMTVTGTGAYTESSKTFATTLLKNSYSYDSVGNITNINDSVWGETQAFAYDELYRLTSASATGGLANYSETYQYDASTGNLVYKNGLVLNYPAPNGARPHAVTSAGSNTYGYDENGNQTTRNIGGNNYTLGYDAENRLVSVTGPSNFTATFTFDGDGRRVKSVVNGETILFAGGHYELKGSEVTKYYFAGGSRIAVRKYIVPQSSTLTYVAGDHLGSTSLAVDASTGEVIQTRYKPWGEVRYTTPSKTLPTRYTFTGQYSYVSDDATDLGAAGFGLMFYNARWYDPYLNRFTQPDSIVPLASQGTQALDRYAYANNNPVNYADPSGHTIQGRCNWMKNYDCNIWGRTAQRLAEQQTAYNNRRCTDRCDASGVNIPPSVSPVPPSSTYPGICSSSMCNPNVGGIHYIPSYTNGVHQSQGNNADACGPYAIAMAHNMYYGTCSLTGDLVEGLLETGHLKPGPGLGVPSWYPVADSIEIIIPDAHVTYNQNSTVGDLISALSKGDIVIVEVSWLDNDELNSTDSPGHFLVAVGYDEKNLYFLDPGRASNDNNGITIYTYGEFNTWWNGTSNYFILPGSMWIIPAP